MTDDGAPDRNGSFIHRELVILAWLIGLTIATFFATRSFAAANASMRRLDAQEWYKRGERALHSGNANAAVAALRRATGKDPGELAYDHALADALVAAHQDDGAQQVLLGLREQQADDPDTNLQLARLEAHRGDVPVASRYYQYALAGLWAQPPAQRRVRTEFIQLLLSHGERDRALSELIVLDATLPPDVEARLDVGRLFLTAGDARRALDHFLDVLRLDPQREAALAGAGEASFQLGDYAHAREYLTRLPTADPPTAALRTLTALVLDQDPLAPRLPMGERQRRLADAVTRVIQRLEACASASSPPRDPAVELDAALGDAQQLQAALSSRLKPNTSDEIEAGLDRVARAERRAERACGSPEPLDRALLIIARRHGLEEP